MTYFPIQQEELEFWSKLNQEVGMFHPLDPRTALAHQGIGNTP